MKRYRMIISTSRNDGVPIVECREANLGKWVRFDEAQAELEAARKEILNLRLNHTRPTESRTLDRSE
jgi:hypothetical protein